MNELTIVILTKNEEENIIDCIENVKSLGRVIVIDDNSSDHTLDVVEGLHDPKIRTFSKELDDFSSQRNFALEKVDTEWVLFIDADERLSPTLKKQIDEVINADLKVDGYKLKRVDTFGGKVLKYGETKNIKLVRLGRKNSGKWKGKVHEVWNIKNVSTVSGELMHFPHEKIGDFLSEINYYSTIRAEELYGQKVKVNFLSIIFYPCGKFVYNYILKLGFIDSTPGLIVSLFMSFHSFLVRGKLFLLYKREK